MLDLLGERQGKLTVISRLSRPESAKRKEQWWLVKCDCGTEKPLSSSAIRHNHTRSCGCLVGENNARRMPLGEGARRTLFSQFRPWAKDRHIEWGLSLSEFTALTGGNCFYCGCGLSRVYGAGKFHGGYPHNGIDRMNSAIGYVVGNCVPCCRACNLAKHTMSVDEFRSWIERVFHHFVEGSNASSQAA